MKQILEIRVKELFAKFKDKDKNTLIHLLSEVQSNLNNIQKDVISYRVKMLPLASIFVLLIFKIINLTNIPGLNEIQIKGKVGQLVPGLGDINNIIIYFIPVIFSYCFYLFIVNLLYRSQLRFLHQRLYKEVYPELYNQKMHLYTIPHSPGHILKVLHRITQRKEKEQITTKGLIKELRKAGIYLELIFHWLFMFVALGYLISRAIIVNAIGVWIIVCIIVLICFVFYYYSLRIAWQYNNYFNHFEHKLLAFEQEKI